MDKEGGAAYSCISDANGEAIATGRCDDSFTACFSKEGYYSGKAEYVLEQLREIQSVKGEMTDLTLQDITLRQVRNPIDLSVSRYETITIPQYDMWIGFDMERRSWLKPYGCGEHADVLLRFRKTVVHPLNDFEAHMDVSFTNNVHAGFYVKKKNRDSCLLTDYCAETNMPFKTTLACAHAKHLKQRVWTGISEDDYLVFRTRTNVDERGRLVSANYGKIVGRWGFYGAMRAEAIVFNPTPNDTNLEDADTVRRMMKQREK